MREANNVVHKGDSLPASARSGKINETKKPVQLWGREFDIVKEGLAQSQVIAFVTQLIDQQQTLAERIKQLTVANDRLLSYFKNLIAETKILEGEIKQTSTSGQHDIEARTSGLSLPISGAGDNGHKESLEAEKDCEFQLATMSAGQQERPEEAIKSADETAVTIAPADDSPLFEGETEIIIAPPVDKATLVRLRRNLQNLVHLKILRTDGCWTGANVFTTFIDRPLPLISILMGIPEVKKADLWTDRREGTDNGFHWGLALEEKLGNWLVQKIIVWLKTVEGEEGSNENTR